ncbi:hypothetical protein APR50_10545 [Variovorax paradoxus]|jgi:phage terminase small subunit|uniref:terminase small subunit n=1 Tax=Variovorax paradoxus TaxID=34073 RepID=UPI0006E6C5B4|nr:hypothetical protein APR52_20795 [Variovorax paradoxus]KPV08901.1 hypothetical protein APR50_10545 [Variovorax paradoxus]KPV11398.1 hypothetical protein APR49_09420 [Variovorax paradoxus]KPV23290.1 hypothetical protein APR51_07995 [Variovorax paradoxus]KPV31144.1 hypothetical protein APR48_17610 [Variovorax paradoxus]
MIEKKLTPKQERFVAEYLIDLNATQAATRAGYSARTANEQGARLLANVSVRFAIEAAKARRIERIELTADRVLTELARIAFFDIRKLYRENGSMKAPHELDDDAAAVLAGVDVLEEFDGRGDERTLIGYTKKAKVHDKNSALTLAMRHMGMFKDRLEVEATVKGLRERMRQQKGGA